MQINQSVTLRLIPNATNAKTDGTKIAVEIRTATGDAQTATIRPRSRETPQVGERANTVKRASRMIAVASNWDFEEAGEGCGAVNNIRGSGTGGICC